MPKTPSEWAEEYRARLGHAESLDTVLHIFADAIREAQAEARAEGVREERERLLADLCEDIRGMTRNGKILERHPEWGTVDEGRARQLAAAMVDELLSLRFLDDELARATSGEEP